MASGRRGGGPPDLKGTLGSLLRTTLEQVGAVKDVVEQQARSRGGLLDQALVQRRRKDALTRLGESVYLRAERGEIGELALEPEIAMTLAEIADLDEQLHEDSETLRFDEASARSSGPEAVSSHSYRAPVRAAASSEYRVWRPVMPESDEPEAPTEAAPAPAKGAAPRGGSRRLPRKSAQRSGGGIRFVDEEPRSGDVDSDDDLESYMHDDDVPDGT